MPGWVPPLEPALRRPLVAPVDGGILLELQQRVEGEGNQHVVRVVRLARWSIESRPLADAGVPHGEQPRVHPAEPRQPGQGLGHLHHLQHQQRVHRLLAGDVGRVVAPPPGRPAVVADDPQAVADDRVDHLGGGGAERPPLGGVGDTGSVHIEAEHHGVDLIGADVAAPAAAAVRAHPPDPVVEPRLVDGRRRPRRQAGTPRHRHQMAEGRAGRPRPRGRLRLAGGEVAPRLGRTVQTGHVRRIGHVVGDVRVIGRGQPPPHPHLAVRGQEPLGEVDLEEPGLRGQRQIVARVQQGQGADCSRNG